MTSSSLSVRWKRMAGELHMEGGGLPLLITLQGGGLGSACYRHPGEDG